ncbi:MAG TPA: hypothetical protein VNB22_08995 [Pyrinomonadaceae bacterium]|nr:hypothetical protein [Pyrinomonadaceae bacterium]
MELFNNLGAKVEVLWRDQNYDEAVFPEIAARALKEANLPAQVSAWDVIEWTMNQTFLPEQKDLPGKFGDPPITLYNSPRFHIDVYFWLEGTTAIHQHAFCGAFQVLMGSSIHSWYEFDRSEAVNTFTELGNINLKLCELLSVGDVQPINAGRQYIHGLFHLEQPSATIVVRTHKSPMFLPQFSYYKPFLAIDPFFEEANTTKKMQCVTTLIRSKHPRTDEFIADWLRIADFQTTFQILSMLRNYLRSNQIDQLFNLSAPQSRFDVFMEIVSERHGERANVFPQVFAHLEKLDEILRRRSYVTNPEHRFFLALLLNVEGRERIFSLVKERFPESEPLDKVLDWTFDLAQTRVLGENIPNALGINDFDDTDLFILENLLQDRQRDEIQTILETEYGSGKIENLAERIEKLQKAVIFQPLLQ